jgi:hypothetical protein
MKKTVLATAILLSLCAQSTVLAQTQKERIQELETQLIALRDAYAEDGFEQTTTRTAPLENKQVDGESMVSSRDMSDEERIVLLEQEIKALRDAYIEGAPQRIKTIAGAVEDKKEAEKEERAAWYDQIELGALIQVEAGYLRPFEGNSESDITVATFAPYITSRVNPWISVQGALLYEQGETDLEVDIATVSIANADKTPFYSIIGQTYMPFGDYSTEMISDPLTLEIGETRATGIQVGAAKSGFNINLYTFNGDIDYDEKDQINSFGAAVSYGHDFDKFSFSVGAGYTNNMGDSDGLQEGITVSDSVPGISANATLEISRFVLYAEYVGATEAFDEADYAFNGNGAQPSAYNLEADINFSSFDKDSIVALGYQGSEEAIDLGLPRQRMLATYRVFIMPNTSVAIQYAYDKDYSTDDGGTGKSANALIAQATVVF